MFISDPTFGSVVWQYPLVVLGHFNSPLIAAGPPPCGPLKTLYRHFTSILQPLHLNEATSHLSVLMRLNGCPLFLLMGRVPCPEAVVGGHLGFCFS